MKLRCIQQVIGNNDFDVIHFHNISLVGGPQIFSLKHRSHHALKLMTAHEHWLVCPMSLLWKFNRKVCEQPECVKCTLLAGRPPQLWRYTEMIEHALKQLDAIIFPSCHTLELHRDRGIQAPRLVHLPYFLPDDWAGRSDILLRNAKQHLYSQKRPYFAAVGRLVKEKGFQQLIPLMAHLPNIDLRIAGTGPFEGKLHQLAAHLPNIHFLGLLDFPELVELYYGARALVVPSLFYETFGYVVLEAFSVGTPVIVHHRGALPELINASGGGITYSTDKELVSSMRRLSDDDDFRQHLGKMGYEAAKTKWSEDAHVERYLTLSERA
jgi:glycosyltransferase involved in cell wall biosynthesis